MRAAAQVVLLVLGVTAGLVVLRGLQPIAPALAGALRVLLNPLVLALAVAGVLLWRAGRGRRRPPRNRDRTSTCP